MRWLSGACVWALSSGESRAGLGPVAGLLRRRRRRWGLSGVIAGGEIGLLVHCFGDGEIGVVVGRKRSADVWSVEVKERVECPVLRDGVVDHGRSPDERGEGRRLGVLLAGCETEACCGDGHGIAP